MQKKVIAREVRKTPKFEYKVLSEKAVVVAPDGAPSKPPSRSTLYRVLKQRGLTNFRWKKRLKFTKTRALASLNSVESRETFLGIAARSSSQMSALFRRELATTRSGALAILMRNGNLG